MPHRRPIRVLAVDDSAVMRGALRTLFRQQQVAGPEPVELCGIVEDGLACLDAVDRLHPDVVLLDLEMPRMHGLQVLIRLRRTHPNLPVIMCSSYTEHGARLTLDALSLGARDYVTKPGAPGAAAPALQTLADDLFPRIAALAEAARNQPLAVLRPGEPLSGLPSSASFPSRPRPEIVVIGLSTGGPLALESVLRNLPADFPVPILIAQHMPRLLTEALAERLGRVCPLPVREARDQAEIAPGRVFLAPGDTHMEVARERNPRRFPHPVLRIHAADQPGYCRPSVDRLFRSAAHVYGDRTLALVMTGMGADGLDGARCVHEAGGTVLAQDEASAAVWGMPGRVWQAGLVRQPLPLSQIAPELIARVCCGSSTFTRKPAAAVPQADVSERSSGGWNGLF